MELSLDIFHKDIIAVQSLLDGLDNGTASTMEVVMTVSSTVTSTNPLTLLPETLTNSVDIVTSQATGNSVAATDVTSVESTITGTVVPSTILTESTTETVIHTSMSSLNPEITPSTQENMSSTSDTLISSNSSRTTTLPAALSLELLHEDMVAVQSLLEGLGETASTTGNETTWGISTAVTENATIPETATTLTVSTLTENESTTVSVLNATMEGDDMNVTVTTTSGANNTTEVNQPSISSTLTIGDIDYGIQLTSGLETDSTVSKSEGTSETTESSTDPTGSIFEGRIVDLVSTNESSLAIEGTSTQSTTGLPDVFFDDPFHPDAMNWWLGALDSTSMPASTTTVTGDETVPTTTTESVSKNVTNTSTEQQSISENTTGVQTREPIVETTIMTQPTVVEEEDIVWVTETTSTSTSSSSSTATAFDSYTTTAGADSTSGGTTMEVTQATTTNSTTAYQLLPSLDELEGRMLLVQDLLMDMIESQNSTRR